MVRLYLWRVNNAISRTNNALWRVNSQLQLAYSTDKRLTVLSYLFYEMFY